MKPINTSIFKAYDVRGLYPSEMNEELAYRFGRAVVLELQAQTVVVGRDARTSSPSLFDALSEGITDAGADVFDLGLATTPQVYFASHILNSDVAIALTASHNPPEYNGLKLCKRNAEPIGLASGLDKVRDRAVSENDRGPIHTKGRIIPHDITAEYTTALCDAVDFKGRTFRVATDTACAMGILELPILEHIGIQIPARLYDTLDGTSSHEANPLKQSTLNELSSLVSGGGYDLGIAYDGDADRVGFVDELGEIIGMDIITAIIAKVILIKHPGSTILADLRSSLSVRETVEKAGGTYLDCRVGHPLIKKQMKEVGAIFAGELSGHYYFGGSYIAERGSLPVVYLLNAIAESGKTLSRLVSEVKRYFHSGEIDSEVEDVAYSLATVEQLYKDGTVSYLDGIKVSYPDWWFSVRSSNTEPLVRLNCEATSHALMEQKRDELIGVIRGSRTR